MKKLYFIVFAFLQIVTICNAQNKITVKGTILKAESVGQIFLSTGDFLTSLDVSEDNTYTKEVDIPVLPAKISLAGINMKTGKINYYTPDLWVESGEVELNIDLSKKNEYELHPIMDDQKLSEQIQYADKKERKQLIKQNSNSFPALYFLYNDYFFKENKDLAFLEDILAGLDQDYTESYYGKLLDTFLKAKKEIPVKKGKQLMPVELFNKDLKLTSLIEQNNKKKIICYTSTGCGYSKPSMAFLAELQSKIDIDKYEIITVWDDSSYEIWQHHIPEIKNLIQWTNFWDRYRFTHTYLNIDTTPTFFIVDENNVLLKEMKGISSKTKKELLKACNI